MKVAFCGIVAALSAVLMFLTGLVPVATLAIPAIAGCLLIPVVVESGLSWGFGVYAVCSVLSFLLAADREAALFYVLFFGYYPPCMQCWDVSKTRCCGFWQSFLSSMRQWS